jgi:uncharacterized protein (TIGR02421 family)
MVMSLAEINERAVAIAANIKLLGSLSWPNKAKQTLASATGTPTSESQGQTEDTENEHLRCLKLGLPLPSIEYPKADYSEELRALETLAKSFSANDPAEIVTLANIQSYMDAAHMVHARGTTLLTDLSIQTFGKPGSRIPGMTMTNLEAAEHLISLGHDFEHPYIEAPPMGLAAEEVARDLESRIAKRFAHVAQPPRVSIIEGLSAKASATSETIRLRAGTGYSKYDARQLFAHEVMTHSLTALNGLHQPVLKTMGRGAPRTTATQEGLATFSELVTGSIDLKRLLRLALRIVAIDRALSGADFRETFEFFMEHGQGLEESYHSAARIFRGGQPDGGCIFTKDVVYLDGLIRIHTLFRWALANKRLGLVHLLFCGRLTLEDCFLLEESYDQGLIAPPLQIPEWYENIEGLAGQLTFSLIIGTFDAHEVETSFNTRSQDSLRPPRRDFAPGVP